MRRAAALLVALASGPALAAPEEYVVEPGHTFPSFAVSHLGISTQRGRFDRTRGRIVLDREAGTGRIDIEIDARSASTGNPKLDEVVRSEDFLNAASHPVIAFHAAQVNFAESVPVGATGELTLAGATRPVTLRISGFACTRLPFLVHLTCGAQVSASLRRSEFGITSMTGLVGDEVAIEAQVEAILREPPPPAPPPGG